MRSLLLLVVTILTLAACSGLPPKPMATAPDPNAPLEEQLEGLKTWTALGKASLRNSRASDTVSLLWEQHSEQAFIVLSGPLGVGATQIQSDGKVLRIRRQGAQELIDISSREEIIRNTGWDLPLQALPYWLKGLPYPELEIQHSLRAASSGHLISLRQDGWSLEFQQFSQHGALMLPSRIRMEKEDTRVLVVIREWKTETSK